MTRAPLYAFVHIAKTGGTTLIHSLRKNFLFRCVDVRPLHPDSAGLLRASDLATFCRLAPSLTCIFGHSVRTYSNIEELVPDVRYLSILRDPVGRCISHYQQRGRKYGDISIDEFLQREWVPNFQTRAIAGVDDLDKAKQIVDEKMALVGLVEEFDDFLCQLMAEFGPETFDARYEIRRTTHDKSSKVSLREQYADAVARVHQNDIALYDYVKTEVIPRQRERLGDRYSRAKQAFEDRSTPELSAIRPYLDYLFRHAYIQPLTGWIRRRNGLPWQGIR